MTHVVFVCPCYNMSKNALSLVASLSVQTNVAWRALFIDDASSDQSYDALRSATVQYGVADSCKIVKNNERKFALRNIIESSRIYENDKKCIVALVDGDDELCNTHTVDLLINVYDHGADVAWTSHRWDINGMNISREMPRDVNPYQWPWCTSHLKTFRASMLCGIKDINFCDRSGNWFQRGYDQALMLPLLRNTPNRVYVPEVCYLYKINSCSITDRDWVEHKQISTINFVRARGFVE